MLYFVNILELHHGKYIYKVYIKKRVIEANIVKSTYIIEKEWDLICVQCLMKCVKYDVNEGQCVVS